MLLAASILTFGVAVAVSIWFSRTCRELGCMGMGPLLLMDVASFATCITATTAWLGSVRRKPRISLTLTLIGLGAIWFALGLIGIASV